MLPLAMPGEDPLLSFVVFLDGISLSNFPITVTKCLGEAINGGREVRWNAALSLASGETKRLSSWAGAKVNITCLPRPTSVR